MTLWIGSSNGVLAGDSAVRQQVLRDLMDDDRPELRASIAADGDAATLLAARNSDRHWGRGFYQPKWTGSHYTLLEVRNLELPGSHPAAQQTVRQLLLQKGHDGGVNPSSNVRQSDLPGETHLDHPAAGQPNRWVTLKALRVALRLPQWRTHDNTSRSGTTSGA